MLSLLDPPLTALRGAEEEDDDSSTPPSSPPVGAVRRNKKFDDEEAEDSDVRSPLHLPRTLPPPSFQSPPSGRLQPAVGPGVKGEHPRGEHTRRNPELTSLPTGS